jgi:phenylalanyl-tRNA synthetase beta chain
MLISIDWIKDFVDIPSDLSGMELGQRFTMASAEVEKIEESGKFLKELLVARIESIEPHPDADKLNLVTFNFGANKSRRVVCGASNVAVGMKVPYAPLGVTLPAGFTLEPKKIRGVLSEGMLCSREELGIVGDSSGLMELPTDAVIGETMHAHLGETDDVILDVDNKSLTHRPDLWGHHGIAREFSTIFSLPLGKVHPGKCCKDWKAELYAKCGEGSSPVKPRLKGESAGILYYGLTLSNVTVTDSPDWMQRRLKAVGLRPINNIVDISNYVMLELGQPLHIFDRDLIDGDEVVIHRLEQDEKFVTLDEAERTLVKGDTVISDSKGPLVIGGIMGGLKSGVTETTSTIFIEVANWKPSEVRRTSTRLGLRTDSSMRYEKSLDSRCCERTLLRTLEWVLKLSPAARVEGKVEYDGIDLSDYTPLVIETSMSRINSILGHTVSPEEVERILTSLGFKIESGDEGSLQVTVPSYRATKDVECEADIVEEIGRMVGYDNITPTSPLVAVVPVKLSPAKKLQRKLRDFMVYQGNSFEVITYPMVGEKLLEKSSLNSSNDLKILNPISSDADRMRDSLVPSMLATAALNAKHQNSFRLFELGRTYHKSSGGKGKKGNSFCEEHSELAIMFYHNSDSPFMDLVNTVESMMRSLSLPADMMEHNEKIRNTLVPSDWRGLHPFELYHLRVMGKVKGFITSVHPQMLRAFKLKGHLALAIIDLTDVERIELKDKTKYHPLPKYQSATFDWTVMVDNNHPVAQVLRAVKKANIKEMVDLKVLDVYQISDQERAVTLHAKFMDKNQTLKGDFIADAERRLVEISASAGYPLKS